MAIAFISDIHSNLEALTSVLEYLDNKNITEIYCLGDIVGYGPDPNACVDLVREKCKVSILGNHDHAVSGLSGIENFNEFARKSTIWTRKTITKNNLDFLLTLSFEYNTDKFQLVHATPSNPELWHYLFSKDDIKYEMNFFEQQICFIGHSHMPIVYHKHGYFKEDSIELEQDNKYIVNVGSVGQPRDRDNRACFCVLDFEQQNLKYIRLKYDIKKTYEKILSAGLPKFLAERLLKGY